MEFSYDNDVLKYTCKFKSDFGKQYSGDEFETVRSALYYNIYGKVYTDSPLHSFIKPRLRPIGLYLTAFRAKANIMLHSVGLRWAEGRVGHKFEKVSDIPSWYLHSYGLLLFFLKTSLFPVSVYFFYKILGLVGLDIILQRIGTIGYVLIPSVFLFIGWFDIWENVALYCFIIVFYFLLAELLSYETTGWRFLVVPLVGTVSALFRPHLLIFNGALYAFVIAYKLIVKRDRGNDKSFRLPFISLVVLIAAHIPILVQNHSYFGKYTLSTQSKYEFFQGHNPFARGSWYPAIYTNNSAYFDSILKAEHITQLNELEEGEFYEAIGKNWMKNEPLGELELTARKVAGYFLPYNFINARVNLFTLFMHLSFFGFVGWYCVRLVKRKFANWHVYFMVLLPTLTSLLLTDLFFTGERWRFYADPFFWIMGLILIQVYLDRFKISKTIA
jgi:hypothetical protein